MTILSAFDIGLVVLILGIGASTIAAREAFAAVIGFVVYGLLLAIAWVRLSAVDVALTEAAIGGGMTGMLMLLPAPRSKGSGRLPSVKALLVMDLLRMRTDFVPVLVKWRKRFAEVPMVMRPK